VVVVVAAGVVAEVVAGRVVEAADAEHVVVVVLIFKTDNFM
jgi:hypothetical protein